MVNPTATTISPPKVLVIYAHPDPDNSIANQTLINKISDLEHVLVHDIYAQYPDFFIDVHHEQQLLLQHDVIVFQHPLYMYSCPSLLKEWFDRVLAKRFAFGEHCALQGKSWRNVITTGGKFLAFDEKGYNKYPLEQILQPFELTAALCKMEWFEPLVQYWSHHVTDVQRQRHAQQYREWLISPCMLSGGDNGDCA